MNVVVCAGTLKMTEDLDEEGRALGEEGGEGSHI